MNVPFYNCCSCYFIYSNVISDAVNIHKLRGALKKYKMTRWCMAYKWTRLGWASEVHNCILFNSFSSRRFGQPEWIYRSNLMDYHSSFGGFNSSSPGWVQFNFTLSSHSRRLFVVSCSLQLDYSSIISSIRIVCTILPRFECITKKKKF